MSEFDEDLAIDNAPTDDSAELAEAERGRTLAHKEAERRLVEWSKAQGERDQALAEVEKLKKLLRAIELEVAPSNLGQTKRNAASRVLALCMDNLGLYMSAALAAKGGEGE